jgi:hypothetical protein
LPKFVVHYTFIVRCGKSLNLIVLNDAIRRNNLARFKVDRLPTLWDGEQAKQARELMRRTLFEQWLIDHP